MRRTPMKRTGFKTVTELRGAVSQILTDESNARLFKFLAARYSTTPETEREREQRLVDKARRAMNSVVPRAAVMGLGSTAAAPIPKAAPVRSEAYRRAVASLPCINCKVPGYSQCAHSNSGKGAGIKASDLDSFPLCTVHPGADGGLVQGCHERFDQGALFSKAVRRELEPVWAADTQRKIHAMGLWPKGLPVPDD